jgi:autotransporter-associated beta strand protein
VKLNELSGFSYLGRAGLAGGAAGRGEYNISGGEANVFKDFRVGANAGTTPNARGDLNVSSSGLFALKNTATLVLGYSPASTGNLTISGGTVDIAGSSTNGLQVGLHATSTATVKLDGGTLKTPKIIGGASAASSFKFNGGVLQAAADTLTFISGLSNAELQAGGAVINTGEFGVTVPQLLSGAGALTKQGDGVLLLDANNTYLGDTTIQAGTLALAHPYLNDNSRVTVALGAGIELNHSATDEITGLSINGINKPSGVYGAIGSGAQFELAEISGTGKLRVLGTPYQSWATSQGLTQANDAPSADPDGDRVDNLLEYYLAGNPLSSVATDLPLADVTPTHLTLRFRRLVTANTDLTTQNLEYGSNLSGWTTVAVPQALGTTTVAGVNFEITSAAGHEEIIARIPQATNSRVFVRLTVTQ